MKAFLRKGDGSKEEGIDKLTQVLLGRLLRYLHCLTTKELTGCEHCNC